MTEPRTPTAAAAAAMLRELPIWRLSNECDSARPDSAESPGAQFLDRVRDGVAEAIDYDPDLLRRDDFGDQCSEIAREAPSVYTYPMWQQFTDLAAWTENPDEFGAPASMEDGARSCLTQIADRLACRLFEIAKEFADETDTD